MPLLTGVPPLHRSPSEGYKKGALSEEDYCEAIAAVQQAMERYVPSVLGYAWDPENPGIQLKPQGGRGYIELRAAKAQNAADCCAVSHGSRLCASVSALPMPAFS